MSGAAARAAPVPEGVAAAVEALTRAAARWVAETEAAQAQESRIPELLGAGATRRAAATLRAAGVRALEKQRPEQLLTGAALMAAATTAAATSAAATERAV